MPDSDAPISGGAKGFWLAFLGSGALILAICLFNLSVDPIGQIGLLKIHALNRVMPASVVSFVRNNADPAAYERTIAGTSADTFLIGTSREERGFDLCDKPNLIRIAGSSWGIRELAHVQNRIIETRTAPATLLIDVGLAGDGGQADRDPRLATSYAALSPQTTLLSIQTVFAALAGTDEAASRFAGCRPLPGDRQDWPAAAQRFEYASLQFDAREAALRRGRAILEQMVGSADRICAKTGIRHTLIFFSLPGTPGSSLTRSFDALLKDHSQRLSEMFRAASERAACRFRYLDLVASPPGSAAERQLWRDRDQWLDFTHFSPGLGRIALDYILEGAGSE